MDEEINTTEACHQSHRLSYLPPLGGIVEDVVYSSHFGQNCAKSKAVSKDGEKYFQL
jgi:hypothetical protein